MTTEERNGEYLAQLAEQHRKSKLSDIEHLTEFVTDNAELEQLEDLLGQFNLFEAIGMVWQEIRHSAFLAFLLNPNEAHGLGDAFLKRVIQRALLGADTQNLPINVIELHLLSLDEMTVERERDHIDILLLNPTHRLALIIENKVLTDEHDDQLKCYYETIQRQYPDWRIIGIYLTPTRARASHPAYLALSYAEIADILDKLLTQRGNVLGSDITTVLQHYTEMLRRHIVSNPQIDELCRQIYQKHKKAIDLIIARIPDRLSQITDECKKLIEDNSELSFGLVVKRWIGFYPIEWSVKALQFVPVKPLQKLALEFYFFFETDNSLRLALYIQPTRLETYDQLLEMARKHPDLFRVSRSTTRSNRRVYSTIILTGKEVNEGEMSLLHATMRQQFTRFLTHDLPKIKEIVAKTEWIWDKNFPYANEGAEGNDTDELEAEE